MTGRRRKPRARSRACIDNALPLDFGAEVDLVCGCRAGRPRRLGRWMQHEDEVWSLHEGGTWSSTGDVRPHATPAAIREGRTWHLTCPSCQTPRRLPDDRLAAILTDAVARGLAVLDLVNLRL